MTGVILFAVSLLAFAWLSVWLGALARNCPAVDLRRGPERLRNRQSSIANRQSQRGASHAR